MSADSTFAELLDAISDALGPVFEQIAWANDEISKAQQRHPRVADALHHSFALIRPSNNDRMHTEFVYRAYARELLDRVARGEDTRLGTAAEVVIAMCQAATVAPLNATGYGLLLRTWATFPDQQELTDDREHREKLHGSSIDHAEADTRAKLAVPDRVLGTIECRGWHHGQRVDCAYAPQTPPVGSLRPPR